MLGRKSLEGYDRPTASTNVSPLRQLGVVGSTTRNFGLLILLTSMSAACKPSQQPTTLPPISSQQECPADNPSSMCERIGALSGLVQAHGIDLKQTSIAEAITEYFPIVK